MTLLLAERNNKAAEVLRNQTGLMRNLFLLICFTGSHFVQAQFTLEKSIQLLLYGQGKHYGVVPAGEQGVIIYAEAENFESSYKRNWEIINLNPDFELNWKTKFESDTNFEIKKVKYFGNYIYLMFEDTSIPVKSVFFVRADMQGAQFEYFKIEEFIPSLIEDFEILGNSLFLIGTEKKSPAILKFRFGDIRPTVLKGLYTEHNEILNIEVLPDHDIIQIITRIKKSKGSKSLLVVKHFDENGNITQNIRIESSKGHRLLDAKAKNDDQGNICIVGTYASGNSKESNGIFTMVYQDNQAQPLYYYDYANLHHFFDYLPPKEQEKLTRKYEKNQESRGLFKANHQTGGIEKIRDQWIYTGEIIRFVDKSSSYRSLQTIENKVFSHAVVLGIAGNGKLIWDKVIELNDLSSSATNRQVFVEEIEGKIMAYYLNGFVLNYQLLERGDSEEEDRTLLLNIEGMEQINPAEQMNAEILPWHANNFMTFGSFSTGIGSGQNKNIFYINKVSISSSNGMNK